MVCVDRSESLTEWIGLDYFSHLNCENNCTEVLFECMQKDEWTTALICADTRLGQRVEYTGQGRDG